jgi:uncharacterized protein YndB with AHSA1/START domain
MGSGDRARVTTFVKVDAQTAFDVFTRETDLWWRRGPRYRFGGARRGTLHLEPGAGGRLFEEFEDRTVFVVGRVLAWEPPERLVFEWRLVNFAPGERTEVEVRFEPGTGGTRVTVEHRGWSSLPEGHPARHGMDGAAFAAKLGLFWGNLATALRRHIDARTA